MSEELFYLRDAVTLRAIAVNERDTLARQGPIPTFDFGSAEMSARAAYAEWADSLASRIEAYLASRRAPSGDGGGEP